MRGSRSKREFGFLGITGEDAHKSIRGELASNIDKIMVGEGCEEKGGFQKATSPNHVELSSRRIFYLRFC